MIEASGVGPKWGGTAFLLLCLPREGVTLGEIGRGTEAAGFLCRSFDLPEPTRAKSQLGCG